jgi:hypothetical protein
MGARTKTPGKYKDFLDDCYEVVKNHNITSFNLTKRQGLALCINFLEIPVNDSGVIAVTVSVMENRKKKAKLDAIGFARVCSEIEGLLLSFSNVDDDKNIPYWVSLVPYLLDGWYSKLKCHRLFFIPKELLPQVIMGFTNKGFIAELRLAGNLKEVSFYLKTNTHDMKLVTLSDKD